MSSWKELVKETEQLQAQLDGFREEGRLEGNEAHVVSLRQRCEEQRGLRLNSRKRRRVGDDGSRPQQPMSALMDILLKRHRLWPISDCLIQMLNIKDIITVSRTCKIMSDLYQDLLPSYWNIDTRLGRFFHSPFKFRQQMRQSKALIAGTFALQFFGRLNWRDVDLDVFIRDGDDEESMLEYLVTTEVYREVAGEAVDTAFRYPNAAHLDDEGHDLPLCIRRLKKTTSSGHTLRIKLYVSGSRLPIMDVLTTAYTSATANFISWDKAYSIFPKQTFIDDTMFLTRNIWERSATHLARMTARGWEPSQKLLASSRLKLVDEPCSYRTDDSSLWRIKFDISDMRPRNETDEPLDTFSYRLCAPPQGQRCSCQLEIRCTAVESWVLRHAYMASDAHLSRYIKTRLDKYLLIGLCRMPPNERPEDALVAIGLPGEDPHYVVNFNIIMLPNSIQFEKPANWEYVDHLVPRICDDYLDSHLREAPE